MTPGLQEGSLVVMVQALAEQFHAMYGLDVDTAGVDPRLAVPEEPARVILYRAIRELLFNVAKHADAKEASIRLALDDGVVRATVRDTGSGFESASVTEGIGLLSIRERIESLGGAMHLESAPGRGTEAAIEIPLAQREEP